MIEQKKNSFLPHQQPRCPQAAQSAAQKYSVLECTLHYNV